MTTESQQLEAQSRAAIKSWCDDPSVQLEWADKGRDNWEPKLTQTFYLGKCYYRIAKPKKWYRVAKMTIGTTTADSETQEKRIESSTSFIEWIDDERKYYD